MLRLMYEAFDWEHKVVVYERRGRKKMKKGLFAAIAAVAALALCTPTTVSAANSPDGQIVIEERNGNGGIKTGMTAKEVDAAWGTSIEKDYGADLVVVYVGDAHVTPETATNVPDKTVAASEYKGTVIAHKGKKTQVGKSITLKAADLSPVVVLGPADKKTDGGGKKDSTPRTGDTNTALWGGMLVLSMLAAGAALAMKKSNA